MLFRELGSPEERRKWKKTLKRKKKEAEKLEESVQKRRTRRTRTRRERRKRQKKKEHERKNTHQCTEKRCRDTKYERNRFRREEEKHRHRTLKTCRAASERLLTAVNSIESGTGQPSLPSVGSHSVIRPLYAVTEAGKRKYAEGESTNTQVSPTATWVAAGPESSPRGNDLRSIDDGILLVVPARISGHCVRALVDSGASESFISPSTVTRCGLDTVQHSTFLELADGTKVLSQGKVPDEKITVGSYTVHVPFILTYLLEGVDVVLGMNWLTLTNPYIDWTKPCLFLPTSSPSTIPGQWLPSSQALGIVKVIKSQSELQQLQDPQIAAQVDILHRPRFWQYIGDSQQSWRSALPEGVVTAVHQEISESVEDDVYMNDSKKRAALKRMPRTTRVQGKPIAQKKSKLTGERQIISAKRMAKLVKGGETCFLGLIRPRQETSSTSGMTERQKKVKSKVAGPKKKLPSIAERIAEVMQQAKPVYQKRLGELLQEFKDIYPDALPKGRPPKREIEHKIKLAEGVEPANRKPYRLSPIEQDEMETQIRDLLAQGFIQPSVSPWGSPILFVPKKDGRWRMCIDYRALNKSTIKDSFPLPRIDDLLDRLGRARYFSKLDLTSGYHQIAVRTDDIPKTAFRTNRGCYEFIVMPFGLCNAPATFQRLMNKIFDKEINVFVLVYLDDILIFSEDIDTHFEHLRTVMTRLRESKLYARLQKCTFLEERCEYLGFEVSAEGVHASPEKVQAIVEWPRPQCLKDVRSFIGLCNYYRRFIRKFSEIARPLTDLTKGKVTWQWEEAQQKAFEGLKRAMATAPVLHYPDFDQQFVITTDASLTALGAVIEQDFGNGLQPIAYASRKLSPQECRYSPYERELLGMVWAIGQWRHFLQGQHFVIRTDHDTLKHLPNQPSVNRRVWKWVGLLQPYDMEIQHIGGKKNPADPLSRQSWKEDREVSTRVKKEESDLVKELSIGKDASKAEIQETLSKFFNGQSAAVIKKTSTDSFHSFEKHCATLSVTRTTITVDEPLREAIMSKLQEEETYQDILEELLGTEDEPPTEEVVRGNMKYRIRAHALFVHNSEETRRIGQYWKLVLPDDLEIKKKVLREVHTVPYQGHIGFNRTLEMVKRGFFWKGMTGDVRDFVLSCPICQAQKAEYIHPRGEAQPLQVPEQKWQEVSLDFVTKLPETIHGHDTVMTVVDRATKLVHFIPCKEAISASGVAALYWKEVGKLHGIPKYLYSDRDTRFIASFWEGLWRLLGTGLRMGTAYHPRTQGQVERYNQILEQTLRCTITQVHHHREWDEILPLIEFAVNSAPSRTTGYSPFYLTYGYHPTTPTDLLTGKEQSTNEAVNNFTRRLHEDFKRAQIKMREAAEAEKTRVDRRRTQTEFSNGEWVLLSTTNLKLQGTSQKLRRRFVGPFRIESRIGKVAYKLSLPEEWQRLHPVFHVSLLRPFQQSLFQEDEAADLPPLEEEPIYQMQIERFLRWRWARIGRHRVKEYLVLWKDLPHSESTWMLEDQFLDQERLQNALAQDQPTEDIGQASSSS